MLHTVNKSAFTSTVLSRCLESASPGDDILLLNDGVYGAGSNAPSAASLEAVMKEGCGLFALKEDVEKRGLSGQVLPGVQLIGFAEFVDLTERHTATQSWF